jgi:hypothetical protein
MARADAAVSQLELVHQTDIGLTGFQGPRMMDEPVDFNGGDKRQN